MTRNALLAAVVVIACVALEAAPQEKPPGPTITGTFDNGVGRIDGWVVQAGLEKPAQAPVPAAAPVVDTPRVADQDQQAFVDLLYRVRVQQEILAVLQKEVDSTNAEIARLLARLQKPEFDLTRDPQTGRLVHVKKPEPPKKEVRQ